MKNLQLNKHGTAMRLETISMLKIERSYFFDYTTVTELEIFAENLRELYYNNLKYLINLKRLLISAPALTQIHKFSFISLRKLQEIRLELKNIYIFDQDFTHMTELQKITLFLPNLTFSYDELYTNDLWSTTIEIVSFILIPEVNYFRIQCRNQRIQLNIENRHEFQVYNIGILAHIYKLSLNDSNIIDNFVKYNIMKLTYLSLQNCLLVKLDFLTCLINLTYLDISYNKIILEDFSFCNNNKLRHLNISFNSIKVIKTNYFYGLNELLTLKMNQCEIFEYENSLLQILLPKLTHLYFTMNYFKKITKFLFLEIKYLTILDLRYCEIKKISKKAFRSLTQLEILELGNNRIKNFSKNTFYKLTTLIFLNISHNTLKEFNINKLFQSKYINNLKILNLNYNSITQIPDNNLANFPKLTDLDLKFNHITLISDHLFAKLNNLNVLNLSYNSIEIIDSKAFDDLCCLKILNLGNNLIKYLDKDVFYMLKNLNFLDLSNNCIQLINHKTFNQNSKLENIQLDLNEITELPCDIFYSNDQLKFLNISFNPLLHLITSEMFRYCKQFHLLIIDENLITKVDDTLTNKIDIYDF